MEIIRIAADNNDIDLPPFQRVVGAWLQAGSDTATIKVYNALTVTGTEVFSLSAIANTCSPYLAFGSPGVPFKTAISVDITGTSAVFYLVIE